MMTLHGVDIFIRNPEIPDLPKEHGPFKLILISSRGTKVWPGLVPDMELDDWPRCRYESVEVVTDAQVQELVNHISELGWQWTKCQKLFQIDGSNAYSQPY